MKILEPQIVNVSSGRIRLGIPSCPPKADFHWRWHTGSEIDVAAFGLSKNVITNAEYREYISDTQAPAPSHLDQPGFNADDQPVVGVDWHNAKSYCQWLTDKTSQPYRLPRDVEWEYAARGGQVETIFPWGNALDPAQAAFGGLAVPPNVGSFPPNGFGLNDMIGNVWEWCEDRFEEVSEGLPAVQRLAEGDDTHDNRVLRGGAYMTKDMLMLWIAYRHEDPPAIRHESIGFRVALGV